MASTQTNTSPDQLESRQAAMRNRIITHLNADHAFSLQIYLQHFCKIPEKQASNAKITDITTDHMIIESRAGRNLIPLDPPMKSLSEARERSVAMHREAMAGLGLSDVKIDKFVLPNKPWQIGLDALVVWIFATLPWRDNVLPEAGSLASQIWSLGGFVPGLARLAYVMAPYTMAFVVVAHSIEAGYFAGTRLRKHQVPKGSAVWCLYVLHVLLGGAAGITTFDNYVKQKEHESKKSEKH